MAESTEPTDSRWSRALALALGARTEDDGICLFLEEREGLVVEADSRSAPEAVRTRSRGFAVRSSLDPGPGSYVAEPSPDEIARLTGMGPAGWPDRKSRSCVPTDPPRLDASRAASFVSAAVAEAGRLRGVWLQASWVAFVQEVMIARPARPLARDSRMGERVRLVARIDRGRRSAMATVESTVRGETGAPQAMAARLTRLAARRAEERLDARQVASGRHPVVFAPGVGGIVAHELIGHALEADVVLAGGSWITDLKEPPGSALTVLDDPRLGRAAWRVDDEGENAGATPLLRSGRVQGWMHDRQTARETGCAPNGHGRRASFREEVRPRMGCTYVSPGDLHPEEVLGGVDRGIYVRRMESAGTDPRTGRAVFRVADSDLIRHGRLDRPQRPHVLVLSGPEVVRTCERIANDLAFDTCIGSCHRDGQTLATSVGAPTICVGSGAVVL